MQRFSHTNPPVRDSDGSVRYTVVGQETTVEIPTLRTHARVFVIALTVSLFAAPGGAQTPDAHGARGSLSRMQSCFACHHDPKACTIGYALNPSPRDLSALREYAVGADAAALRAAFNATPVSASWHSRWADLPEQDLVDILSEMRAIPP